METLVPILVIILFAKADMVAHVLNIIFRLPHPGPNDIQGSRWCRKHEGPAKYTFGDYVSSILPKGRR